MKNEREQEKEERNKKEEWQDLLSHGTWHIGKNFLANNIGSAWCSIPFTLIIDL
jgi:hypothetical protein